MYLAFDWLVAVCHYNCDKKIGLYVDDDWQVVAHSSSSQSCDWQIMCAFIGSDCFFFWRYSQIRLECLSCCTSVHGELLISSEILAVYINALCLLLFRWYLPNTTTAYRTNPFVNQDNTEGLSTMKPSEFHFIDMTTTTF